MLPREHLAQFLRPANAAPGDEAGEKAPRRDVECRVGDRVTGRNDRGLAGRKEHFACSALFDGNVRPAFSWQAAQFWSLLTLAFALDRVSMTVNAIPIMSIESRLRDNVRVWSGGMGAMQVVSEAIGELR